MGARGLSVIIMVRSAVGGSRFIGARGRPRIAAGRAPSPFCRSVVQPC